MQGSDIICPKCHGNNIVRAGFVNDRQRHRCRDCNYHFTSGIKGISPEIKRLAMHLYLEGMGFRAIARISGVSDVAVAKWIRPVRGGLDRYRRPIARVTEMHKLEHFFVTKELFNKFGWLLIGIEENRDICLLGSYATGNCRIADKI